MGEDMQIFLHSAETRWVLVEVDVDDLSWLFAC